MKPLTIHSRFSSGTQVVQEQRQGAADDEVNRSRKYNDSVEPMGRAGSIRLDRFQQTVLAASSYAAEQENAQIFVVSGVKDQSSHDTNKNSKENRDYILQGAQATIHQG